MEAGPFCRLSNLYFVLTAHLILRQVWWTSFGKYKEYAVRRSEQRAVSGVGAVGPEDHYV